jgi:prenyltransferase beta subunit
MFTRGYLGHRAREAYPPLLESSPWPSQRSYSRLCTSHTSKRSARCGTLSRPPAHARPTRAQNTDDLAYHLTAHLRLNAVYWGLTALSILGAPDALDREELVAFVLSCWDDAAGARARSHGP